MAYAEPVPACATSTCQKMIKIILFLLTAAVTDLDITTNDSLLLSEGTYGSILFTASSTPPPDSQEPATIRFETSGDIPAGMLFERYPCNKPDTIACPALASSDGIYLDGVPRQSGSFQITITATNEQQGEVTKQFTVVVKGQ